MQKGRGRHRVRVYLKVESNEHLNAEMNSLRKGKVESIKKIQREGFWNPEANFWIFRRDSKDNQHTERSLKTGT